MFHIKIDKSVTPEEALEAREEAVTQEKVELWRKCIQQALCVVSARDNSGKLVGIGFLVGNMRHGEIVDLSVHSSHRQHGLGGKIFDALVAYSKANNITYLGLTWDTTKPWLHGFYERHGFRTIDFSMWHTASLPLEP